MFGLRERERERVERSLSVKVNSPGIHQDEGKLGHQVPSQGAQEEFDSDRVGDDEPEDVFVLLVSQESGGGETGVVTLQSPVHGHP